MAQSGFDYIVVGGGASGCVVASRLSQAFPSARIALVEAGPKVDSWMFSVPALGAFAPFRRAMNWNHETIGNADLDGRAPPLLQGRLLGGSGAINGMVMTRGHGAGYDRWQALGCDGWGRDDVLPAFRQSETNWRGADRWHGDAGPIGVSRAHSSSPLPGLFLEAAARAGFAISNDLNADACDAFGWTDVNIARGRRQSTAHTFLTKIAGSNLTVLCNHPVERICFAGRKARSVLVRRGPDLVELAADTEIVLCAGAIKTAHLLLLSGIGPQAQLHAHGINPLHDAPNVGANLQNHPSFSLRYPIRKPLSLKRLTRPDSAARALADYVISGGGPLSHNYFPVAGFFRTDEQLEATDAQAVMSPVILPPMPAKVSRILPKLHGMTVSVQQGTPWSRGSVSLRSAAPSAAPVITTGAYSDPRDMAVTVKAVRKIQAIMAQSPIAALLEDAAPALMDDDTLVAQIRSTAGTAYHQCGTCVMGPGETAVTDLKLRVRGVDGLRIGDGSIMPLIPNAALHAPTIMIAERAAAFIIAEGNGA